MSQFSVPMSQVSSQFPICIYRPTQLNGYLVKYKAGCDLTFQEDHYLKMIEASEASHVLTDFSC